MILETSFRAPKDPAQVQNKASQLRAYLLKSIPNSEVLWVLVRRVEHWLVPDPLRVNLAFTVTVVANKAGGDTSTQLQQGNPVPKYCKALSQFYYSRNKAWAVPLPSPMSQLAHESSHCIPALFICHIIS